MSVVAVVLQASRPRSRQMCEPASHCISPPARQKFADLALVWLMLATQLEEREAAAQGRAPE
jgi:hypothetical protein